MLTFRWFIVPMIMLGIMFVYDSISYDGSTKVEGLVVRTYIKSNDDSKSEMAEVRFGNATQVQSIGSMAYSLIKPGDRLLIASGKITGAWMSGDLYRSEQLIVKNLKLNRSPIFLIGIFIFMLSIVAFTPRSWLGTRHGMVVKRPIIVFGSFSLLGVLYYVGKMLTSVAT
jgi:hypothetical protein